ncbi:MAG TPA: glycosyltransferase [Longimicrobiales bacterium]|nr:glycosyltransferase [Longimicrobiales bacterium]
MSRRSEAPRVTILLAARDRLALLRRAVASALQQEFDDFDVLVVDDGSGDATRRWLDARADREPRLRVLHQPPRGIAAARQAGLLAARGELVCILDSDDELASDALRRIVTFFDGEPPPDLVYTDYWVVREDGSRERVRLPDFTDNDHMIRATLVRPRVPFKHSGTTFRRDAALAVGGYDESLALKVDVDLYLRFLSAGLRVKHVDQPVVSFLMHRASVSRRRLAGIRVWSRLIDRYAPPNPLARAWYRAARFTAEGLKAVYERAAL